MKIRSKWMILGMPLLAALLMTGLWAMSHSAVQAAPQATYTVTTNADSGGGSLRQAVLYANANPGVDTVNFDPTLSGQTIGLTSGVIAISEGVSINGSGLTVPVTISGNNNSQIFTITAVDVSLNNLRIINGRNVGGSGGAIFLSGAANVVINNSVIADNFATYDGGAIFLGGAATMDINNSVIADNVADLYNGGAIRTEGTLNVMGTTFINNESGVDGGAIENNTGDVTITNSTFTRNSASQIGAVMNQNNSTMVIVNSTFVDNDNVSSLGAIGNRNFGTLTIANTIGGGASPICFNQGVTLTTSSNLFDDGSCSATSGNPYLAPLDDNGGSTPTHALMVFSGAVGAGDSTYCPATDQRGISRATNCDLGAFEVQTADYLNVCRPGFTGGDTLIFASTGITTTVDTVGSLSQLCVTITETDHPSATPGLQTGLYWSVNETAASNNWSLTMSAPTTFALDVNDKLCRYTGTGIVWDCAMTSIDTTDSRITRSGITQLSHWAVGNNVGPLAVTMQSVTTDSASTLWLPVAVVTLLLLLTSTAVHRLRRREG